MDLSIIIPVYNESDKIKEDIKAASSFLAENKLTGEIIVVDDGSDDGTAAAAISAGSFPDCTVKVIDNKEHKGKGFAVRTGVGGSLGSFVMFVDSGLCIPYNYILPGLQLLNKAVCDIAHGSRKLPESKIIIPLAWKRRFFARLFRWFVSYWLKVDPELTDTQCGFKIYRGEAARELYGECKIDGFMFDIEIILRAAKHGYRIEEFPIRWRVDPDSRLSFKKSAGGVLAELYKIRKELVP